MKRSPTNIIPPCSIQNVCVPEDITKNVFVNSHKEILTMQSSRTQFPGYLVLSGPGDKHS